MHWMNTYFDKLQPPSERHRQLLTSARDLAKKFAETNMLMARQLANPFPPYVLAVVVCWAAALFLGNGSWPRRRMRSRSSRISRARSPSAARFFSSSN